jgi:beta-lactamase class C
MKWASMYLYRIVLYLLISLVCIVINFQIAFSFENKKIELDSILAKYDTFVENFIENRNVPGVAIAVVIDSQIIFIKGYGVKKVGENEPIGAHSVFRISSLSKGFASVLSGLLVKDGVFNWDDKVIKYLPDFSLKDTLSTKNLTIRHLLSHTSGLIPHAYDNLIEANVPLKAIIKELKTVSVICPVGKCYGYQNTVYGVISELIESVTDKKYTELLKERLIQPLGMEDVSFSKKELRATMDRVYPHIKKQGEWTPTRIKETYYNVQAAAGINASVYDMALWVKGLLGGSPEIIPSDIVDEVTKPIIKTPREVTNFNWCNHLRSAYYGMGWRVFDYAGYTMVYHSGGLNGYLSQIAFLPEYKIGIVSLQNAWFRNCFIYKFIDMYFNIEQ